LENKNILITSGGVETALNVVKALRISSVFNCTIVTSDMDPDSFGKYFSDKNYLTSPASSENFIPEILEIISKERIDFIFPCHSSEIKIFAKNKELLEKFGAGIIVPNESIENICSNKKDFIDFIEKNSFPYPRTYKSFKEIKNFPIFIRPSSGSSSKGSQLIQNILEISDSLVSKESDLIIQEYIDAPEITVDAYRSKKYFFSVSRIRKRVKDGKSIFAELIFDEAINLLVKDLLTKLNYIGPCNVQLFFDNNRFYLIEINPRLSAGGLPLSVRAGLNIPEIMLKDYFNHKINVSLVKEKIKMIRYLDEKFV